MGARRERGAAIADKCTGNNGSRDRVDGYVTAAGDDYEGNANSPDGAKRGANKYGEAAAKREGPQNEEAGRDELSAVVNQRRHRSGCRPNCGENANEQQNIDNRKGLLGAGKAHFQEFGEGKSSFE